MPVNPEIQGDAEEAEGHPPDGLQRGRHQSVDHQSNGAGDEEQREERIERHAVVTGESFPPDLDQANHGQGIEDVEGHGVHLAQNGERPKQGHDQRKEERDPNRREGDVPLRVIQEGGEEPVHCCLIVNMWICHQAGLKDAVHVESYDEGHGVATPLSKDFLSCIDGQGLAGCDRLRIQDQQKGDVGEYVHRNHEEHAPQYASGQRLAGLVQLASQIVERIPAIVGPEGRDDTQADHPGGPARGDLVVRNERVLEVDVAGPNLG
mmetsp:Transcript_106085/g.183040  ORF Transcript_106085/g.183040 Transcript_106085/m.183040 type:complete len:264 (-) Transcript_106085:574-1365(-)